MATVCILEGHLEQPVHICFGDVVAQFLSETTLHCISPDPIILHEQFKQDLPVLKEKAYT